MSFSDRAFSNSFGEGFDRVVIAPVDTTTTVIFAMVNDPLPVFTVDAPMAVFEVSLPLTVFEVE